MCLVLPAELKAEDKLNKSGDTSYLTIRNPKSLRTFTVWIEKPDDLDERAKILAKMGTFFTREPQRAELPPPRQEDGADVPRRARLPRARCG